jgi:hypothetical protein
VVLSLLVLRSGSILPAMLFHLLNNGCALLAGRLLGLEAQAQPLLDPRLLATAAVAFVVGMVLALRRGRGAGSGSKTRTGSTTTPPAPRDRG